MTNERQTRLLRLEKIRKLGINPYPSQIVRSHKIADTLSHFNEISQKQKLISVAGRLKSIRIHGRSTFANLEDESGRIQIYLKEDKLGQTQYRLFTELLDMGDFIKVRGSLFVTKKGEKTVLVDSFKLLTKSLRPLPAKWYGLSQIEIRYRQRYLDLLSNPLVRDIFKNRSLIIKIIREFLNKRRFIEVETPILQPVYGGANARPFVTHHTALDMDLYLRIAPELYLKRLIVGGFEKVYEIARCFRNEGIDHLHNPEFTQIELYWAYSNYQDLMKLVQDLLSQVIKKAKGQLIFNYEDKKIDFTSPYRTITFVEAMKKYVKLDLEKLDDRELIKKARLKGIKIVNGMGKAKILDELYKKFVRPNFWSPTFLTNHPIELSPLSKQMFEDHKYAERFQLIAAGIELVNGFSELNDPIDQASRFTEQQKLKERGDLEAHPLDNDFIEALEYGMPPTAGLGMGIDRVTMLLTDTHNLKEVILFPTLKPKKYD